MEKVKHKQIKIMLIILVIIAVVISILAVNNATRKAGKAQAYGALEIEKPYNNYPPVPQGYVYKEGTIETGYVIQDTEGNEFVWVPIDGERIEQVRKDYAGETLIANCNDDLSQEHMDSLSKYRGFYIGRYEASSSGISKAEGIPTSNITKAQAIETCENYNDTENRAESVSHLIYGVEYDMAIQFIETANAGYGTSTDKGNYTSELKTTGASNDINLNIYDIAGNLREWTMEEKTSNGAGIIRGGSYNNAIPAGNRSNDNPQSSDKYIGYRVAMYVKDIDTENPSLKVAIATKNTTSTGFDVDVTVENAVSGIAKIEVFVDRVVNKTVNNPTENTNTVTIIGKEIGKEYEVYARVTDGLGRKTISKIEKATPEKKYVWAKYEANSHIDETMEFDKSYNFLASTVYYEQRGYWESWRVREREYKTFYVYDTKPMKDDVFSSNGNCKVVRGGGFEVNQYVELRKNDEKIYYNIKSVNTKVEIQKIYSNLHARNYYVTGIADVYTYTITYSKGNYIEEVESTRENAYAKSGVQGDHWYEYIGTK